MNTKTAPLRTGSITTSAGSTGVEFDEAVEHAQAFAQEKYDKLLTSIRRNPLQAAGIAAGVGFVLALLARR